VSDREFVEVSEELQALLDRARELRAKIAEKRRLNLFQDADLYLRSESLNAQAIIDHLLDEAERVVPQPTTPVDIGHLLDEVRGECATICIEAEQCGETLQWAVSEILRRGGLSEAQTLCKAEAVCGDCRNGLLRHACKTCKGTGKE
jgi:hypothetical protein